MGQVIDIRVGRCSAPAREQGSHPAPVTFTPSPERTARAMGDGPNIRDLVPILLSEPGAGKAAGIIVLTLACALLAPMCVIAWLS